MISRAGCITRDILKSTSFVRLGQLVPQTVVSCPARVCLFHHFYGTLRDRIENVLKRAYVEGLRLSASEVAFEVTTNRADVEQHLEHLEKSWSRRGLKLEIESARCRACDYVFRQPKRRLEQPKRCPMCRSHRTLPPKFSVREI